jgi:hypothetical protein
MNIYSLFELAQLRAINVALEPSQESIWRMRCREYSVKYNTPLHVVMNELDPLFVLQQLYEEQFPPSIVDEEIEELLERLYKIRDPEYTVMSKEETEALVDNVLNREIKRLGRKKRPTEEMIEPKKVEVKNTSEEKPKSGSMTFGDLEKIEESSEANKAGFD